MLHMHAIIMGPDINAAGKQDHIEMLLGSAAIPDDGSTSSAMDMYRPSTLASAWCINNRWKVKERNLSFASPRLNHLGVS